MKEFRELSRTFHNNDNGFMPYSIELVNDTLNEWNIKVYQFDTDSQVSHNHFTNKYNQINAINKNLLSYLMLDIFY